MTITMDAEGRLVIPAEIREEAGLRSGEALEIRVHAGRVEIEPVKAEAIDDLPLRRSLSLVRGKTGAGTGARAAGAAAAAPSERPQLDLLIRMAIAHRRLVELEYASRRRRVEPHDYGLRNGEPQLLVFQRSGEAASGRSGEATGWRSLKLVSISDFRVLDETFPGGRPADRHIEWERLFASVSKQPPAR